MTQTPSSPNLQALHGNCDSIFHHRNLSARSITNESEISSSLPLRSPSPSSVSMTATTTPTSPTTTTTTTTTITTTTSPPDSILSDNRGDDTTQHQQQQPHIRNVTPTSAAISALRVAASNPTTPGSSSPPRNQSKPDDFIPPTRPSSTPFPPLETRTASSSLYGGGGDSTANIHHDGASFDFPESPIIPDFSSLFELTHATPSSLPPPPLLSPPPPSSSSSFSSSSSSSSYPSPPHRQSLTFTDLPTEIHESILDHLFGYRVSVSSKGSTGVASATQKWSTVLRHSRRKELSELALVSRTWRYLVQERLYRHLKLKATASSLARATCHFSTRPDLASYVKHIELWFPVFEPILGPTTPAARRFMQTTPVRSLDASFAPALGYTVPPDNCTLHDTLQFVSDSLPEIRIVTLEGGERRKAPMVRHFRDKKTNSLLFMPKVPSVQTLITKGQWNLLRDVKDFHGLLAAFPNLSDWHGSYSKPKSKAYLSMGAVLPTLSPNIKDLHVCLEADYRSEAVSPLFYLKVTNQMNFCARLAEATPPLEHFSYTGRICHSFFDALYLRTDSRATKLKTIDIIVRNCCPRINLYNSSGCGIQDMAFIKAFEALVVSAVRCLRRLTALTYLRIRFVDLESLVPPLNPYFIFKEGVCTGVWSNAILNELHRSRPSARYEELSESFGEASINKDGRLVISPGFRRSRVISLKIDNYQILASGILLPPQ